MLRLGFIVCLWLLAASAWAVSVNLVPGSPISVYAHPNATDTSLGQLPGGGQVNVIATDASKGFLLIDYQKGQAWIKANSVVDAAKTDNSVQQVVNHALTNASDKVSEAVATAQSKLTQSLNEPSVRAQVHTWTDKQARGWFLTGALIFMLGLILGLLLGKLLWRPKRSFLR